MDNLIKFSPKEKGYDYNPAGHKHYIDGKPATGVTSILGVIAKPALISWAANMAVDYILQNGIEKAEEARTAHRKKRDEAGQKGTDVHRLIENWIKDGSLPEEPNEQFTNFINWIKENKVKFFESEKHVWSEGLFIAGILDFICEIDGKKFMGDIKTGSGIYPEHFYQMAGYRILLEEMGEKDFDGSVVVNLKKNGEINVQYRYDYESDKKAFLGALDIYRVNATYNNGKHHNN